MKHFIILALAAFMAAGFKDDEKEYYPSGKLKWESHYDSSCNCDHFTSYYENGAKLQTANYAGNGGYIDGAVIDYFDNGKIAIYCVYSHLVPQGRKYANFYDGTLGYECFYTDGYKSGTWTYFNEDKTLRLVQHFEQGKTSGTATMTLSAMTIT